MNIGPNQNVDIIIDDGARKKTYRSRVEDMSEERLLIAAPFEKGYVVPIRADSKLWIEYYDTSVKNQGKFQAEVKLERRISTQHLPLLLVSISSEWTKIQVRSYVRVDVLVKGSYSLIIDKKPTKQYPCTIKDISGGGCLFITKELLEKQKIILDIALTNNEVRAEGSIVRVRPMDGMYEYGVSFTDIEERVRQEVIQFVFQRQLEIHRKGVSGKP